MLLIVVTPVGPGHEQPSLDCDASIKRAWAHSRGPFTKVRHIRFDDSRGRFGRSRARNLILEGNQDADWYFFLDADDLCRPEAFERFGAALQKNPKLEALFGAIQTDMHGVIPENKHPMNWGELLKYGAHGTLSMGCFVKADAAWMTPFNEDMNAAEDFDFYMRLLKDRQWDKLYEPLVTIRRSVPSAGGPKGYTSLQWREACQAVVDRYKDVVAV